MSPRELTMLLPLIVIACTSVAIMLVIAFYRRHGFVALLTCLGLGVSLMIACILYNAPGLPLRITPLIIIDRYALFFTGLILAASLVVAMLSYSYLERHDGHSEEFYILLLIATLGCMVLASAAHFASFFLGIEILSVSLYALAAYLRHSSSGIEAGVKYLILAAVSSAFILFGMALVYADTGSMAFNEIAAHAVGVHGPAFLAGTVMVLVGLGFKLGVAPFHLWTPDVYEGAPAPVTAFIATASKGAVFALALRYFGAIGIPAHPPLFLIFTIIAIVSMFTGNLLALLQTNVKRILAYSSISHIGYLLLTMLASGEIAAIASIFYLIAYFITTLGAFGVVTVLSGKDRDADNVNDYQGLAWKRPWLAGVFTAMLLSLAGIPLTAGFVGKFYVIAAGVGSALWLAVMALAINSVIGLFYYLRIIVALYDRREDAKPEPSGLSRIDSAVLSGLTILLIWIGMYPGPVIGMIRTAMPF